MQPRSELNASDTEKPIEYHGWVSPELGTGPTDEIHISKWFPPNETPSLALRDSMVPIPVQAGGRRRRTRTPMRKRIVKRKQAPFESVVKRILKHQAEHQNQHTRRIVADARWPITLVPAPTARDLLRPQRREMPNGLIITYRQIDAAWTANPPANVDTVTSAAAIREWFRSVMSGGNYKPMI